jgi:hypothetical protein
MKPKTLFAFIASLASFSLSADAANVAMNPGFENAGVGGPTDAESWNLFAGGAPGTLSERGGSNPSTGSFAARILALGADGAGASAGINQDSISLGSLAEGTSVDATFDWLGNMGPGGVAFGALRIRNGVGAILEDSGLLVLGDTAGSFENRSLGPLTVPAFGAAPNDSYSVFFEVSVAAGAFDGSSAEGFVDNVIVNGTVIPEPSASILAGLTLLGFASCRRRQA